MINITIKFKFDCYLNIVLYYTINMIIPDEINEHVVKYITDYVNESPVNKKICLQSYR